MNNCGISRWDDPQKINAQLKALTDQPIWEVTDDYYNNVILKYYDEKCTQSRAVYEESQKYIPGGVQHNLAFNKPFPMCMAKAEGAYLYDKDGNKYIDFLQAGGPTILGSNYPAIREKVFQLLNECGPVTGLLHESEMLIAREINRHMPNVEMFRMLGSGTEAVMASLRIARIATGKKRIIKIGGAYHGWSDQMVYGLKIPGSRALLESHGIPKGAYAATDEVRPNDLDMLERMLRRNKLRGGTAAVIVEPVGPESGTRPIGHEYNKGVRSLCDRYGALMIFDEVVTGFRVALSGAQGYFDVVPDLTIFGKIVAGGYPSAGGVGGKREYGGRSGHRQAPRLCGRHSGGQSPVVSCGLHGHSGDRAHQRLRDRRSDGRPPLRRPQEPDRPVWPALRGLQPGFHRSSGMHRSHELRLLLHVFPEVRRGSAAQQRYDVCPQGLHGAHGRGLHGQRHRHSGRKPPVYLSGRHAGDHRRSAESL